MLLISRERDVAAAEAHAGAGEQRTQVVGRRRGVFLRGERRQHDGLAAVARDELREVARGIVKRALEALLAGQLLRDADHQALDPWRPYARRRCS